MLNRLTKHERTNIVPLRIVGNMLGGFASNHLFKAMCMDEDGDIGLRYRYHGFMWKLLNKPYQWWGTYYELNI